MSDRDEYAVDGDRYASNDEGATQDEAGPKYGPRMPASHEERVAAATDRSFAQRYRILLKRAELRLKRPPTEAEDKAAFYYLDKVGTEVGIVGQVGFIFGTYRTVLRASKQGWKLPMFLSWSVPAPEYKLAWPAVTFGYTPFARLNPRVGLLCSAIVGAYFWKGLGKFVYAPLGSFGAITNAPDPKSLGRVLGFTELENMADRLKEQQNMRQSAMQSRLPSRTLNVPAVSQSEMSDDAANAWESDGDQTPSAQAERQVLPADFTSSSQSASSTTFGGGRSIEDTQSAESTSQSVAEDYQNGQEDWVGGSSTSTATGSKWDQIRAQTSEGSRRLEGTSSGGSGSAADRADYDRQKAQREFDDRLEKERKGGDF